MKTRLRLEALTILALLPVAVAAEDMLNYTYFDATYVDNGMDRTFTAIDDRETVSMTTGDGQGLGIRMSLALSDNIHVFAGYSGSDLDLNATQRVPYPTLDEMRRAFYSALEDSDWDEGCDLDGDGFINFDDFAILRSATGETRLASEAYVKGDLIDWRLGIGLNEMILPRVGAFAQLFWDYRDLDFDNARFRGVNHDFGASDSGIGAAVGLRGRMTDRLILNGRVTYSPVGDVNMLGLTDSEMLGDDVLIALGGEFSLTDKLSLFAEIEDDGDVRSWMLGGRMGFGS